ncbi:MAG: helix-turn-helix domain-containing protein [Ignavibacteriales bacterium]
MTEDVEKINYSIKEAARASGLSVSLLYKLSARRELPIEKIGSRVLIPRREFDAWLLKHRVCGTNGK